MLHYRSYCEGYTIKYGLNCLYCRRRKGRSGGYNDSHHICKVWNCTINAIAEVCHLGRSFCLLFCCCGTLKRNIKKKKKNPIKGLLVFFPPWGRNTEHRWLIIIIRSWPVKPLFISHYYFWISNDRNISLFPSAREVRGRPGRGSAVSRQKAHRAHAEDCDSRWISTGSTLLFP